MQLCDLQAIAKSTYWRLQGQSSQHVVVLPSLHACCVISVLAQRHATSLPNFTCIMFSMQSR